MVRLEEAEQALEDARLEAERMVRRAQDELISAAIDLGRMDDAE